MLVDAQLGVDEPREDAQRTLPTLAKDARFAAAVQVFGSPWKLESDEDLGGLVASVWPLYFFDPECAVAVETREVIRTSRISVAAMKASSASNDGFLVRGRLGIPRSNARARRASRLLCSPVQAEDSSPGDRGLGVGRVGAQRAFSVAGGAGAVFCGGDGVSGAGVRRRSAAGAAERGAMAVVSGGCSE